MNDGMKAATIYDVARVAGVSHQTVSRFLSGYEGIRPETRARVEHALAELDYRANSAARQLRSQRTNRIGVIADRVDQTGPARVIAGATLAAQQRGYLLDVVLTNGLALEAIESALAVVTEHRVIGIMATAQTDLVVKHLQQRVPPLPLAVDSRLQHPETGQSMNEYSGAIVAEHLVALGHRRFGYVSGPVAWIAASGRRDGFTKRVEELGGTVEWHRSGDWSAGSGADAWRGLGPQERSVTAIAVGNDSMAIGLIHAAEADGVAVPGELSVMGNDDFDEARYLRPALSTVRIDFEGEGRALIEALIGAAEGATEPPAPARPPELVPRDSTGPVR
jgi:DNA-binding LacI/PurR family transcriptional regulator